MSEHYSSMIRSNMVSTQEKEMERKMEEFATSSLKMFPKELCKILETMSDNDVLNLMQIYDQHLSQSHDAWEKHSLILNMALTARETERIVEITSQAERELSNNLENMFKAFEESDLGDRATVLNVMQMTQEDMSTEHRTKLERGRLIGRVEIPSFMKLKMIDVNEDEQGEKLHFQKITEEDMKEIGGKFIDSHPELPPPNLHFSPVKSLGEVLLPKEQRLPPPNLHFSPVKSLGEVLLPKEQRLLPPNLHFSPVKSLEVSLPKKTTKIYRS